MHCAHIFSELFEITTDFVSPRGIETVLKHEPGSYCIRINNIESLPLNLKNELTKRNHNILYIGIAEKSLKRRLLQELKGKGHGTLFRIIGPLLGYFPVQGSLVNKKNKNNYTFDKKTKELIIEWIDDNLSIIWTTCRSSNLENIEDILIKSKLPLLNTSKNPAKLKWVEEMRDKCRKLACSSI